MQWSTRISPYAGTAIFEFVGGAAIGPVNLERAGVELVKLSLALARQLGMTKLVEMDILPNR